MTAAELHKLFYVAAYVFGVLAGASGLASWLYGKKADEDKARRDAVSGVLTPKVTAAHSPFPYPELELGDSGAVFLLAGPAGAPFIRFAGESALSVRLDERRRIRVSTLVRDASGAAVAEIVNNEWKVNPGNMWDRNYNANALEVRDRSGDVVLQVRLVGTRVQFQAKMYDTHGTAFAFGKGDSPWGVGGIIEQTGPAKPELRLKIDPLFRYPSDRHFGELARK